MNNKSLIGSHKCSVPLLKAFCFIPLDVWVNTVNGCRNFVFLVNSDICYGPDSSRDS